jgi:hypothetical protein
MGKHTRLTGLEVVIISATDPGKAVATRGARTHSRVSLLSNSCAPSITQDAVRNIVYFGTFEQRRLTSDKVNNGMVNVPDKRFSPSSKMASLARGICLPTDWNLSNWY